MNAVQFGEVIVLTPGTAFLGQGGEIAFEKLYQSLLPTTRQLVVDLTDIEELDSKRLAAIVVFYKRARAASCAVTFCSAGPTVKEVLRVTRLDRIFTLVNSREEAVRLPSVTSDAP